jgi:hypothetical protein
MSKQSVSAPQGWTGTDASFRAWGKPISDLMESAGLAKTADTGQVDWATVAKPASTQALIGYEIRKLSNSTLGDIYFRIEWRTAATAAMTFLRWYLGSGTDGAGNLTGLYMPVVTSGFDDLAITNARSTVTNQTSYCFVDDGTFALALNPGLGNGSTYTDLFVFARTSDSDGAYNGNGWMIVHAGNAGQTFFRYWSAELQFCPNTSITNYATPVCLPYPYSATQGSIEYTGHYGAVCLIEHLTPKRNWHKNIVCLNAADAAVGATVTATVLGASHTYLSMGTTYRGVAGGPNGNNSDTKGALALLWD